MSSRTKTPPDVNIWGRAQDDRFEHGVYRPFIVFSPDITHHLTLTRWVLVLGYTFAGFAAQAYLDDRARETPSPLTSGFLSSLVMAVGSLAFMLAVGSTKAFILYLVYSMLLLYVLIAIHNVILNRQGVRLAGLASMQKALVFALVVEIANSVPASQNALAQNEFNSVVAFIEVIFFGEFVVYFCRRGIRNFDPDTGEDPLLMVMSAFAGPFALMVFSALYPGGRGPVSQYPSILVSQYPSIFPGFVLGSIDASDSESGRIL